MPTTLGVERGVPFSNFPAYSQLDEMPHVHVFVHFLGVRGILRGLIPRLHNHSIIIPINLPVHIVHNFHEDCELNSSEGFSN